MRVSRCFTIDCPPDAAWDALHRTASIAAVYAPMMRMDSEGGLSDRLRDGDELIVRLRVLGLLSVGRQAIRVSDERTRDPEGGIERRTMHDRGGPLSGPLSLLRLWHHRMTVVSLPDEPGRARWEDTLEVGGSAAPLLRPALAIAWSLRGRRIRRLARRW